MTTTKHIDYDETDRIVTHLTNRERETTLSDLVRKYPELQNIPYSRLWYRVTTLAEAGCIGVKKERRDLVLFAVD